jgi:hypothetical protein
MMSKMYVISLRNPVIIAIMEDGGSALAVTMRRGARDELLRQTECRTANEEHHQESKSDEEEEEEETLRFLFGEQ